MYRSVYDFKAFYNSAPGEMVRRVIGARIRYLWPDARGMEILGCGYAVPFLDALPEDSGRVIAMMPRSLGADHWPAEGRNLVALVEQEQLPLSNCSMDRILMVHHLEHCENLSATLRECWRVIKPNGRLMVIVPSRTGFWARAEWSPFGHGSPFSLSQLCFYLRDNLFVQERCIGALYTPPIRMNMIMRSSAVIEHLGRHMLPFMAGVHIVEASKQIYAGVDKTGSGTAVPVGRRRPILGGAPEIVPQ